MRDVSGLEFTAVGLTVAQAIGLWTAFAPSPADVLAGDMNDDEFRIILHHSEVVIGGMTVLTGGIASVVLKSPYPLVAGLGIVAGLAAAYEWTLRHEIVDIQQEIKEAEKNND